MASRKVGLRSPIFNVWNYLYVLQLLLESQKWIGVPNAVLMYSLRHKYLHNQNHLELSHNPPKIFHTNNKQQNAAFLLPIPYYPRITIPPYVGSYAIDIYEYFSSKRGEESH